MLQFNVQRLTQNFWSMLSALDATFRVEFNGEISMTMLSAGIVFPSISSAKGLDFAYEKKLVCQTDEENQRNK